MAKRNSDGRNRARAQARAKAKAAASVRLVASGVLVAGGAGAAAVGGAQLAGAEDVSVASTYTVANTNDSGAGSLRQAVLDANGNAGADTIVFDPTVTGVITLTTGEIEITDSVTVTGPGAGVLEVSGNDASRVLHVTGTADITISGIALTHGNASSGAALRTEQTGSLALYDIDVHDNYTTGWGALYLRNSSDITIADSAIHENTTVNAGTKVSGVYTRRNNASVTITGTTITDNTGTGSTLNLYSQGDITLSDVTFSGNNTTSTSSFAANVFLYAKNGDDVIITNSTFSDNVRASFANSSLMFSLSNTYISNSTITGNSGADQAIRFLYDSEIDQSTITDNSGPEVYNSSSGTHTLTVSGSIISDTGSDDFKKKPAGTLTVDSDHSIIGGLGTDVTLNDVGGTQTGVTELGLGALADNGGPTPTRLPLADSPAIDAGPDPVATFPGNEYDQRGPGYDRVSGGGVDIGAVELQIPTLLSITPPHGPLAGGTLITLSGTGFAPGMTVTIGTKPCLDVVVISATTATCVTPPGLAPETVDVIVTREAPATLRRAYTYDPEVPEPTFTG